MEGYLYNWQIGDLFVCIDVISVLVFEIKVFDEMNDIQIVWVVGQVIFFDYILNQGFQVFFLLLKFLQVCIKVEWVY